MGDVIYKENKIPENWISKVNDSYFATLNPEIYGEIVKCFPYELRGLKVELDLAASDKYAFANFKYSSVRLTNNIFCLMHEVGHIIDFERRINGPYFGKIWYAINKNEPDMDNAASNNDYRSKAIPGKQNASMEAMANRNILEIYRKCPLFNHLDKNEVLKEVKNYAKFIKHHYISGGSKPSESVNKIATKI